jgi:hypothetical protein
MPEFLDTAGLPLFHDLTPNKTAEPVSSDVVTRVQVCLKSGLASDFAGPVLGLKAERLGLGLGLEHVTRSLNLGLPINLEFAQRPLEKLNQLNNRNRSNLICQLPVYKATIKLRVVHRR